ncbi:MAG TPA: hypothetical protein VIY86_05260, partial [Pirellulaceae bacterium]
MDQAIHQEGLVRVLADADATRMLRVESSLETVPHVELPGNIRRVIRSLLRYDPAEMRSAPERVAVYQAPAPAGGGIVRAATTHSKFLADGRGWHTTEFEIDAAFAQSVSIALPQGARFRTLLVNGIPQPWDASHRLEVAGQDHVTVEYTTHGRKWGWWRRLAVELPSLDLPTIQYQWQAEVPGTYGEFFQESSDRVAPPGDTLLGWMWRPATVSMTHSISKAITPRSLGDNPQTPTRNLGDRSELEFRGAATAHSPPATEILLVQLPAWRAGVWFVFFVLVLAGGLPPRTGDRHAAIRLSRRV